MSQITRRDFVNGTLVAAGASLLSPGAHHQSPSENPQLSYPPALTGLRGSHAESYAVAHEIALANRGNWGRKTELREEYDLIVVGGGLSGLAAAYFYRKRHGQDKRVLILDNHDDFGGHARRNEHTVGGNTRLVFGGSQSLASPHTHSAVVKRLYRELGVDLDRFKTAYDMGFFKRHNLKAATYFNKRRFGQDKLVMHPFCDYPWYLEGLQRPTLSHEEAVQDTPLSENGRQQLLRILNGGLHKLNVSPENVFEYISTHSYFDYLKTTLGVDDPDVLTMARNSCVDNSGPGADVLTIEAALMCGALGLNSSSLQDAIGEQAYEEYLRKHGNILDEEDQYIYHFPDGNATIARSLVKKLIPQVGAGNTAEEIVLSKFDYSQLDKAGNTARIRLNSTVIRVEHVGDPHSATEVTVEYVKDGQTYRVKSNSVVMACYNMMIPYIVPSMPREQASALKRLVKVPLQYTTIGLKNWRAFKEIEVGLAMSPGNRHQAVLMDFPVNLGGYKYTATPDDPCAILMISCPLGATAESPPVEQFREARTRMLELTFKDYEQEIREHLRGLLPRGTFEFDRDVESITINRWAHGYAYGGSALFDSDLPKMARRGRQPFGRITIANIDSALSSYLHVAVDQAWRAVNELG